MMAKIYYLVGLAIIVFVAFLAAIVIFTARPNSKSGKAAGSVIHTHTRLRSNAWPLVAVVGVKLIERADATEKQKPRDYAAGLMDGDRSGLGGSGGRPAVDNPTP
jgi:hypothetical protein